MKERRRVVGRLLVSVGLLVMGGPGAGVCAEVYKWTDAQGVIHYGHRPPNGISAQPVRIERPAPTDVTRPAEVTKDLGNPAPSAVGNGQRVVIYTTDWCPVCRRAKAYLQRQGIAYIEYDVEKSTQGRADYRRLKGRGVPIILVGNQRVNGFNPTTLETLLK